MNHLPAIPVKKALVKEFNKTHRHFLNAAKKSATLAVVAVNDARSLGITVKELVGRDSVSEGMMREWLRQNPGLLDEQEPAWLMHFLRIANRMPEQLEMFGDAPLDVRQMTFQCAGLLPAEAARELAQESHELTPSATAIKYFMDVKQKFDGLIKSAPSWGAETRHEVLESIAKTRKYLDELERKL